VGLVQKLKDFTRFGAHKSVDKATDAAARATAEVKKRTEDDGSSGSDGPGSGAGGSSR
jgi:hypothetical protein